MIAIAAIAVSSNGCKDDDKDGGTASLKVSMENTITKMAVYDSVNIDIQQISIHISTDTNATSGWFDLETNAGIYNLLDYTLGNDTIVAFDTLLQAQTISQVRLLLGDNNTVVEDGVPYDLETPSGQTSGIKLQVHQALLPGFAYILQLDFDPYQSIVKTGNGKYKLNPVIDATMIQVK